MSNTEHYTQDDPRLHPIHPSAYPWKPLPSPLSDEAIVRVSLIPTTKLLAPNKPFTTQRPADQTAEVPCWSFLIEKEREEWAMLWDLGLRVDTENSVPSIANGPLKEFKPVAGGRGVINTLKKGEYEMRRLKMVVLSHKHFDHYGDLDTLPHPAPPILLGPGTLESIGPGHPIDENAVWPASWLTKYTFLELPDPEKATSPWTLEGKERVYESVGCFERGVDWFGDGSFWLIDAPGHCPGHIAALCRVTAAPPTYVLLGGDASHSQDLYLPVPASSPSAPDRDPRSPIPVIDGKPQLATDPQLATRTIGQLTRMSAENNVMVVLAHEAEVEGILPEWPGDLAAWERKGWKKEKERDVERRAKARGWAG